MIITRKALPRRTFLRGMGAAVALPLLDAMVPSMTAFARSPAQPVRRLGFVYMPMGCDLPRWTPPSATRLTELSPTLQSLRPVVDHVTVISNLELKNAYPGTHATSNAAFLSAARAKWIRPIESGTNGRPRRSGTVRPCGRRPRRWPTSPSPGRLERSTAQTLYGARQSFLTQRRGRRRRRNSHGHRSPA